MITYFSEKIDERDKLQRKMAKQARKNKRRMVKNKREKEKETHSLLVGRVNMRIWNEDESQ